MVIKSLKYLTKTLEFFYAKAREDREKKMKKIDQYLREIGIIIIILGLFVLVISFEVNLFIFAGILIMFGLIILVIAFAITKTRKVSFKKFTKHHKG